MFFVAKREVTLVVRLRVHGVHAESLTRSHALTRHMAYYLVLWTITNLKHVLTRLIAARHLENTVLYVVLSNMINC